MEAQKVTELTIGHLESDDAGMTLASACFLKVRFFRVLKLSFQRGCSVKGLARKD